MGKLTAKKVEALREPGRYSDGDGSGFHLRVDAKGRKYWILRLHAGGVRRDVNIGSAARMTLSAARERAREVREQAERTGDTAASVPTFSRAATLTHRSRTAGYRNTKHVAQWLSTLETYVNPTIGEKSIDKVTRADVIEVLTPIWLKTPETARRVLQRIDRVMRWAVGNGHRQDRIDMSLVRDALPPQPKRRLSVRRMPSVPWQDAPLFWRTITASRSAPEVRLALSFLILTASRPGNISKAKRSQIDLDTATWTIPASEMKGQETHRVPLSPLALEFVRHAASLHDWDLLFSVNGSEMSADTLRMMMRRLGVDATPHGFRSTFKEWSRSNGWADHLSESALAHVDPNEVRAAYARSDLLEDRRPMMQAWATFLEASPHSPSTIDMVSESSDPA